MRFNIAMDKKVLIFGFTYPSLELALKLSEQQRSFVIIDNSDEVPNFIATHQFETLKIDYNDDEELKKAGITHGVESVFTFFLEDYKNIFVAISIRSLDVKVQIVSITQTHDSIHKLKAAGVDSVIDPYHISGKRIFELIKKPSVVGVIDSIFLNTNEIMIKEIPIQEGSHLCGNHLHQIEYEQFDVIILGISDDGYEENMIFVAQGLEHRLDAGDILVAIGRERDISLFEAFISPSN